MNSLCFASTFLARPNSHHWLWWRSICLKSNSSVEFVPGFRIREKHVSLLARFVVLRPPELDVERWMELSRIGVKSDRNRWEEIEKGIKTRKKDHLTKKLGKSFSISEMIWRSSASLRSPRQSRHYFTGLNTTNCQRSQQYKGIYMLNTKLINK